MKFGEMLSQLRNEHNMSQAALADQLGVSHQAISKWETGAAVPSTEKLIALAQVFQVPVDTLVNARQKNPDAAETEVGTEIEAETETETEPEPAEAQPPKEEAVPTNPRLVKRLVAATCALVLAIAACIGIYLFAVRGQEEDIVPIEGIRGQEVDISDWGNAPLLPLDP